MPHLGQSRRQLFHAFRHPDQGPHGITQRRRLDQALERADEPRIVLAQRATPATDAANLPLRQRFRVESSSPRLTVERASPVIFETIARPPQPAVRASAAANNRRPRSSSFEPTASHRCQMASPSIMRSTYTHAQRPGIPNTQVTTPHDHELRFSYCSECPNLG